MSLKLLILGIDALPPDVLYSNLDMLPNIKNMCENGVYGEYDGYVYGYGSYDNWVSLYTGLTPKQHKVIDNINTVTGKVPILTDYLHMSPFWDIFNKKGLNVGMWKGLAMCPPKKINGYMISGEPRTELEPINEYANADLFFCDEDIYLKKFIRGEMSSPTFPKNPNHFGHSWEDIFNDNSIADDILEQEEYFNDGTDYFKKECEYYCNNIINIQKNNPVEILFYYTSTIDFISHFQLCDKEKKNTKKALKILDDFVGNVINELKPERVILLSDHGIKPWVDNFPNTSVAVQKEAFGLRNQAVWLKNGNIVVKARIGGFLAAMHALKATFIISGKGIKKGKLKDMRTVDFYPTLLEMFDIKVPENREGYVLDIFEDKKIFNKEKLITQNEVNCKSIAIIQNIEIPNFNRVINEIFLEKRFSKITIFGEEKYKDIFLGNPRVTNFVPVQNKEIANEELLKYDEVFIAYRNVQKGETDYIKIK